MRYYWLYVALLCCGWFQGLTQHPLDSLKAEYENALQKKDYANAGVVLSEIGKYFYHVPQLDSSFQAYKQAQKWNEKSGNQSMIGSNLNDLASIYLARGDFDSALTYYEESIRVFKKLQDSTKVAFLQINLSKIFRERGLYDQAIEMLFDAMRILETKPLDYTLGDCYNALGIVYRLDQKYTHSLRYHRKALAVRKQTNYTLGIAGSLNNIGNVLKDMRSYDSAVYYFERALEVKRTLNDRSSIASTIHNLGDVKFSQGNFEKAKEYYLESLLLKKQSTDMAGQVATLTSLAECEFSQNQYATSFKYLKEASTIEVSLGGLLEQRKRILELYVKLSRATGKFKEASDYAQSLMVVKDSLFNQNKEKSIVQSQARYDIEKRDQQITILNTEKELIATTIRAKNNWIIALIIAITLTCVIAMLIFNSFRLARNGKRRVEVLMKELHHRVKNNLQILSSVLSLQTQHLTDENAILSAKSTEGRINAMALIHRKLYSDDKNTIVSTRGYFRELIEFLVSSYGWNENQLILTVDIDEVELDVDKAIRIGLIVNELISNAFKHAYTEQAQPRLTIQLKQQQQQLLITIKDNGSGVSTVDVTAEQKFGTRMIAMLVKELKGTHVVESLAGTTHKLTFSL